MYMFEPRGLGQQLKRMRVQRRLTQAALAKRAQLSPIFIAKVEAGERMPSWATLERLAQTLEVIVRVALVPARQRR
jgi:transcriptional regulator with XRE-family HTH domain